MKVIKTADNKTKLRMSREEWEAIGLGNKWITASVIEAKKKKKSKDYDPNPWAVCTKSVGRDDEEKYERCVKKVKKQQE